MSKALIDVQQQQSHQQDHVSYGPMLDRAWSMWGTIHTIEVQSPSISGSTLGHFVLFPIQRPTKPLKVS